MAGAVPAATGVAGAEAGDDGGEAGDDSGDDGVEADSGDDGEETYTGGGTWAGAEPDPELEPETKDAIRLMTATMTDPMPAVSQ